MRIEASSIEELIEKSGDKREGLILLDTLICETAPQLEHWLLKSETYVMIGYGRFKYDTNFPLIALAPQKNFISLYVVGEKEGERFTTLYKPRLGKVAVGKSCINIKNPHALVLPEVKQLILDCVAWNEQ